jgi:hypothetical protein
MKKSIVILVLSSALSINLFAQPEKIKAKITERTAEQVEAEIEDVDSWLSNQFSIDPAWITRGNIVLGYERELGEYFSARAHVGVSFKDLLDGVLFDGIIDQGFIVKSSTPSLSYGAEVRYYALETGSFRNFFTGLGMYRRNYTYTGYFENPLSILLPGPVTTPTSREFKTSATDVYLRYGTYVTLYETKTFKTSLELGLSLGMSFAKFFTNETTTQYDPNTNGYIEVQNTSPETSFQYMAQPHVGLNFVF